MGERRITQMIPAVGWQAVYAVAGGTPMVCDLVCWALIEDEDGWDIYPMDADSSGSVERVTDAQNFAGLKGPSQDETFVRALVEDFMKRREASPPRALADSGREGEE